jgi:predicted RNA binding protein YcfA (HicA-like mRNA interferase family)
MRAPKLLALLCRAPLNYEIVRQNGSHRRLESPSGYPPLGFSWHDGVTIPRGLVRKVLVDDVGLSVEEALTLVRGGRR